MRKTACYGRNNYPVDFEWPKENDLLQMLLNGPMRIKDLKYRKTPAGSRFDAFQLLLSNGISSPVFAAKDTNDKNLVSLEIKDYAIVKRVKGTKQQTSNTLHKLSFGKRDGTEIAKVELDN